MDPSPALIRVAIAPQTRSDQQKLREGLLVLQDQDPTIRVLVDPTTGQLLVGGRSELQLEIIVHRLRTEFGVHASVGVPQIVYKETLTYAADGKTWAPVRLEPVMSLEVTVPPDYEAEAIDTIGRRGGSVHERTAMDGTRKITAHVRLANMFGYAHELRSRTRGRAAYALQFERYAPCDDANGDDSQRSFVGAPLKPAPHHLVI